MCFIEYDWMTGAFKFRIGDRFTDFRGIRSMDSLADWKAELKRHGIVLVKTDTRTWELRS